MIKYDNKLPLTGGLHPWISIIVIILFSFGSMILFSWIALLLINFFFGLGQQEFQLLIQQQEINENGVWALFLFQALSVPIGGFIVGPLLYLLVLEKQPIENVFSKKWITGKTLLISLFVVLVFMLVNAVIVKWNMGIDFPEFLNDFEVWARRQEDEATRLTRNLTTMPTFMHFVVAFLVIAILPAIGEELLFRGLIQNKLYAGIGNIHWAIWITGILFSTIHLQFYGFLPRLILGVLFGYMYYWSKNLWVPIFAHFVNNGFTVVILYAHQLGWVEFDMEAPPSVPLSYFFISLIITILLLMRFYNYQKKLIKRRENRI